MLNEAQLDTFKQHLAAMGRDEDTQIAHVAPGETVLPRDFQTEFPDVYRKIQQAIAQMGEDPKNRVVGYGPINPATGLPEFRRFGGSIFRPVARAVDTVAETIYKPLEPVAPYLPVIGAVVGGALGGGPGGAAVGAAIGGAAGSLVQSRGPEDKEDKRSWGATTVHAGGSAVAGYAGGGGFESTGAAYGASAATSAGVGVGAGTAIQQKADGADTGQALTSGAIAGGLTYAMASAGSDATVRENLANDLTNPLNENTISKAEADKLVQNSLPKLGTVSSNLAEGAKYLNSQSWWTNQFGTVTAQQLGTALGAIGGQVTAPNIRNLGASVQSQRQSEGDYQSAVNNYNAAKLAYEKRMQEMGASSYDPYKAMPGYSYPNPATWQNFNGTPDSKVVDAGTTGTAQTSTPTPTVTGIQGTAPQGVIAPGITGASFRQPLVQGVSYLLPIKDRDTGQTNYKRTQESPSWNWGGNMIYV